MKYQVLIICRHAGEVRHIKKRVPDYFMVVTEGASVMGYRADAILYTPGVNPESPWFTCMAMQRLWCHKTGLVAQLDINPPEPRE